MLTRPSRQAPAWRRLAETLKDEGCDSIYLDRLRSDVDVKAHVDKLEEEIAEEMARALSNTDAKCAYNFAKLDLCKRAIDHATNHSEKAKAVDAYNAQRDLCQRARHELIIHRQALGFKTNNHKCVEKHYPLPPRQ